MPGWLDRLKDAARSVLPTPPAPAPAADAPEALGDDAPDAPETANFLNTVAGLAPLVLLGVGLALTAFAPLVGNWAVLGFLLLASAPVVYQLRRVERRLKELVELQKRRRK